LKPAVLDTVKYHFRAPLPPKPLHQQTDCNAVQDCQQTSIQAGIVDVAMFFQYACELRAVQPRQDNKKMLALKLLQGSAQRTERPRCF
jgi:hypothetical protein